MKNYDLIVIGGGVAGLYSIYKYLLAIDNINKNNKDTIINPQKILLLESSDRLGGRLHTIKNKNQVYEAGGARFSENHHLLFELIKTFKLEKKLYPLTAKKVHISKNNPGVEIPINNQLDKILFEIDKIITNNPSKYTHQYLLSKTFYDVMNEISPKLSEDFVKYYPYYSEIYVMNAADALVSLKRDFTSKTPYYILNGGLETIIKKLYDRIRKFDCILDVKLKTPLTNIKSMGHHYQYQVESETKTFIGDKLILAIPSQALLSIPFIKEHKLSSLLKLVTPQPLFRIYAKYKKPWLSNHIVTDSNLNYIIPYNDEGLVMISYTDGPKTEFWYKHYLESKEKLIEMLHKHVRNLIPGIEIPELEWIDACPHWTNGSHYWKPRKKHLDSELLEKKIRHPLGLPNMWIVGEAFSRYQAWVEGSLDTSNKAVEEIINELQISLNWLKMKGQDEQDGQKGGSDSIKNEKKYTMEEVSKHNKKSDAWLVIHGNVYNVTKWIPDHPGGMIIMTGVGKDASKLFDQVGHDSYAKSKLKSFKIGKLEH